MGENKEKRYCVQSEQSTSEAGNKFNNDKVIQSSLTQQEKIEPGCEKDGQVEEILQRNQQKNLTAVSKTVEELGSVRKSGDDVND